jgi:flagellar protein FliS
MLFDGMSRFTLRAVRAIEDNDVEVAHANLHRTGQILLELLSTLREDKGGEIAANLKKIYVYCYERIVIANLKKDASIVKEVRSILGEIGDGFKRIGRGQAGETTSAAPRKIRVTG